MHATERPAPSAAHRASGCDRSISTACPTPASAPVPIRVAAGRGEPSAFRLEAGLCIIGAGEGPTWSIESDTVSRQHAELRLVPEGVCVTDLGSKNGCFYLGQRFQSMSLAPGSRFRIGAVEIEISVDEQALLGAPSEAERYGDLWGVSARHAATLRPARAARGLERQPARERRIGDWKGAHRARVARALGPARRSVRRGQLRRSRSSAGEERAVWSSARRLHGCGAATRGRVRGGQRRHAVLGRDRRAVARDAADVVACARAAQGHARRLAPGGRRARCG